MSINTSATGGYLSPSIPGEQPLPGGLSLEDYIQEVLVGITGLVGDLVRPRYQAEPPKQPDINVNWLAFGVQIIPPDDNAYMEQGDTTSQMQRHEELEVLCSFYGPAAASYATRLRDGLQVTQNRDSLTAGNMGFKSTTPILRVPELTNERWIERQDMTVNLRREIIRTYQILPLVSADGTIETDTEPQITVPFSTTNVEP